MQNNKWTKNAVNHKEKEGGCNGKCLFAKEELSAMRQQVLDSNEMIESLVNSLRIKDVQYNEIRRLNDLLMIEVKKKRCTNRTLKQQLDEERLFYKDKADHVASKNGCNGYCNSIERENKALKQQLIAKSQITYNLSEKLFKIKQAKDVLQSKLDRKSADHLHVIADMLEKLNEAGNELNAIIPARLREPLPANKAKILQIVQRNARLVYENAVLKAQVQNMHKKSTAISLTNTARKHSADRATGNRSSFRISQAHYTTQHTGAGQIQTDSISNSQAELGNSASDAARATMETRSTGGTTDNTADFSIDSCDSFIKK